MCFKLLLAMEIEDCVRQLTRPGQHIHISHALELDVKQHEGLAEHSHWDALHSQEME